MPLESRLLNLARASRGGFAAGWPDVLRSQSSSEDQRSTEGSGKTENSAIHGKILYAS